MYITKAKKYREMKDGTVIGYPYYRLNKSYRDADGSPRTRSVLCLGELADFSKKERDELADMLTCMIEKGQCVMSENQLLYEKHLSCTPNIGKAGMPKRTILCLKPRWPGKNAKGFVMP